MSAKLGKRVVAFIKLLGKGCVALFKRFWMILLLAVSFCLVLYLLPKDICDYYQSFKMLIKPIEAKILWLLAALLMLLIVISICSKLTNRYNLLRKEKGITICQIIILVAIGLFLIGAIFILNIQKDTVSLTALALIGSVLSWIFKDKIIGAAAFIHFRLHGLLNIDDWIQIPKLGVDGEIKRVTLTTVTLYNWDTTISTIPINALQSEHFINLQNMSKGKTYGRRMLAEFIIDTSWIHPIDADEIKLLSKNQEIKSYLPEGEVHKGVLNVELYRLYIYHWLMSHEHVSQRPRLLVRWLEQKESGLVLQVYAFLTDYDLSTFEWQKSQIIEHILESMTWFGLRLYQSPSAYDASNSNIYMAQAPATYKLEKA